MFSIKKYVHLYLLMTLFSLVALTGCGGAAPATQSAQKPTDKPKAPTATSAPVVLATPTPKPAPPTPTALPPTATPEKKQEAAASTNDTPTPQKPAVTDVMVKIPAGPFTMGNDQGNPEDKPAHQVDVAAFELDKFEVTNADFAVFAKAKDYKTFAEQKGYASWRDAAAQGKENHPVVRVTWDDASAYCVWLGKRLPTEAEWEKAARGEDGRAYPWGNDWDAAKANVKESGLRGTTAVGSYGAGASAYGIQDMTGNVWEWTADWYQPYPGNTTKDNFYGEKFRITRGGGWFDEKDQATTFNRNAADPTKTANDDLGFRCAR